MDKREKRLNQAGRRFGQAVKKHGLDEAASATVQYGAVKTLQEHYGGATNVPKGKAQRLADEVEADIGVHKTKKYIKTHYGTQHRRDKKH